MQGSFIIYVATMGTTLEALEESLRDFVLNTKTLEIPKYLVIFYGYSEKGEPKKHAEEIKKYFGPDFNDSYTFEIPDPQAIDVCVNSIKKNLDRILEMIYEKENIRTPILYINPTGGTKVMSFALGYCTLWLIPSAKEYHFIYQGGERNADGRVKSSEFVEIFKKDMKNLGLIALAMNELLQKHFEAAAFYLSSIDVNKISEAEKNFYHGVNAIYYFSIFNFEKAKEERNNYSRSSVPESDVEGFFRNSFNFVRNAINLLEDPIEIGTFLKEKIDLLSNSSNFGDNIREIKKKVCQDWSRIRRFIYSLVAIAKNRIVTGLYPDAVMLSYRIAELTVQLELLKYGISVWNFKNSLNELDQNTRNYLLGKLEIQSIDEVNDQISFRRALDICIALKKRFAKESNDFDYDKLIRIAKEIQSNRNYCFIAHGFDYKNQKEAEKAVDSLIKFLNLLDLEKNENQINEHIRKFSFIFE